MELEELLRCLAGLESVVVVVVMMMVPEVGPATIVGEHPETRRKRSRY